MSERDPPTCMSCDRTESNHGFDGNIATHDYVPGQGRHWLSRELDATRADLAELVATLPKCNWEDDHGKPRTCERPATRYDCGTRGDYFACDECSAGDSPHEYDDLPQAVVLRRIASRKGTG